MSPRGYPHGEHVPFQSPVRVSHNRCSVDLHPQPSGPACKRQLPRELRGLVDHNLPPLDPATLAAISTPYKPRGKATGRHREVARLGEFLR